MVLQKQQKDNKDARPQGRRQVACSKKQAVVPGVPRFQKPGQASSRFGRVYDIRSDAPK